MERHINVDLLKEYIRTLMSPQIVLPGILPRGWGEEFTRPELQTIQYTLKFVLQTGFILQNTKVLVDALEQFEKTDLPLHWFLYLHWETIVPLLVKSPLHTPIRKASLQYALN
ncbi:hypothetical protein [Spirosoma foliorum]|uniref:Uncharacterized protein n=1 Tax=Spirosoma foliorum TaxID=2710596 RepID=A0A7G5H091_9BACT|nr:hypothetical protein [Spirosoma foliorum]QMW04533.1 hypothetical protein H3H32_06220 [Spirosoma foliorum]